jgi:hypothetical protein
VIQALPGIGKVTIPKGTYKGQSQIRRNMIAKLMGL